MPKPKPIIITSEAQRVAAIRAVQALPLPDFKLKRRPYTIVIDKLKVSRTGTQNATLHMLFDDFAQAFGWERSETKEYFKAQYGAMIERVMPLTGEVIMTTKPSSAYDMEECNTLIDKVLQVAAQCGVILEIKSPH